MSFFAEVYTDKKNAVVFSRRGLRNSLHKRCVGNDRILLAFIFFLEFLLFFIFLLPVVEVLAQSVIDREGHFVGLFHYTAFFSTSSLSTAFFHSIYVSFVSTTVSVTAGSIYAYALTKTDISGKQFFRVVALAPLFVPTMMLGLGVVFLFGSNGGNASGIHLTGAPALIISECLYTFPHAVLVLSFAFLLGDLVNERGLRETAVTQGAGKIRMFFSVTIPEIKPAVLVAIAHCFTLSFTDFGAPSVIGGEFSVLTHEIYEYVVNLGDIAMGSVLCVMLMVPAILACSIDSYTREREGSVAQKRLHVPMVKKCRTRDRLLFIFCCVVSGVILLTLLIVVCASFVHDRPDGFVLNAVRHNFRVSENGFSAYMNSIVVSSLTAVFGTLLAFFSAYLREKMYDYPVLQKTIFMYSFFSCILPGLLIGLAFLLVFNSPFIRIPHVRPGMTRIFSGFSGIMAGVVFANTLRFYSVGFLTVKNALERYERKYEIILKSFSIPLYTTFFRVTIPAILSTLMNIAVYFFINSMLTLSTVIFLSSSQFSFAASEVVNLYNRGDTAGAAAMSVLIMMTNITVQVLCSFLKKRKNTHMKEWWKNPLCCQHICNL
jgi:iron(III) transport system permease protein